MDHWMHISFILRLIPKVSKLQLWAEIPQRPQYILYYNELIWVNMIGSSEYIPLLVDLYEIQEDH